MLSVQDDVDFRPEPERLASTWCMAACEDNSDCREDDGYKCRSAMQLNQVVPDTAAVSYKPSAKFCVIPPVELMSVQPDAGDVNADDAGANDAGADDVGADDAGGFDPGV